MIVELLLAGAGLLACACWEFGKWRGQVDLYRLWEEIDDPLTDAVGLGLITPNEARSVRA